MTDATSVAIVGAGVTGLALGYELSASGIDHRILEGDARAGGVIRSARVQGRVLDQGPQRTRLTPAIGDLLDRLELRGRAITAPPGLPLFVYRSGRLRRVPFAAKDFLRSDIAPLSARARLLLEPFTAGADAEESVADYFIRKLGREIYENLAGPLYGGLYASDPADMIVGLSLGRVLRELRVGRSLVLHFLRRGGAVNPPPALSFQEGMEELPRALHRAEAANVSLGAPVRRMERQGGRWLLEHEGGALLADRVVITTPAGAAARLLLDAAPRVAAALDRLTYNPLAVVHLLAETDLRGLGFQVSLAERLVTRGVTFNDSLFARPGLYTAYLGGARAPEVVGWKDAEIAEAALRDFRLITGFEGTAISVRREEMPAWDASWRALEGVSPPSGVHLAANWESRPGLPGRLGQARAIAAELAGELA